ASMTPAAVAPAQAAPVRIWSIVVAVDRGIIAVAVMAAPGAIATVAIATPATAVAPAATPSHLVDRGLRLTEDRLLDERSCAGRRRRGLAGKQQKQRKHRRQGSVP